MVECLINQPISFDISLALVQSVPMIPGFVGVGMKNEGRRELGGQRAFGRGFIILITMHKDNPRRSHPDALMREFDDCIGL